MGGRVAPDAGGPTGGAGPLGRWPGPGTPATVPSHWSPARSEPVRPHRSQGCLTMSLALLAVLVVISTLVFVGYHRWSTDPARLRSERIEDLKAVCQGVGIDDVAAYRRGAPDQLGARTAPDEDDDDPTAVAFALVPGTRADPDAVMDARVMACTTSTATTTESCSFSDPTRGPSLGGGGNVTAQWTTLATTQLRIVDVHSGKVLHRTAFETPNECPSSLRVEDDGSYDSRLPVEQIAAQTEAQVALFHQG